MSFNPIMKRIAILGCSGAGKSTLARALSRRLELPLAHLDALHWLAGWVERDRAEFRRRLADVVAGDRWIIDGNYIHTLDLSLPRADTILVINRSRLHCLWRVTWRWATHIGRTRADMGEGCPEKIDWAFAWYIWTYQRRVAPRRDAAIAAHGAHAQIHHLTGDRQIRRFLEGVDTSAASGLGTKAEPSVETGPSSPQEARVGAVDAGAAPLCG